MYEGAGTFALTTPEKRGGAKEVKYDVDCFGLIELSTPFVCLMYNTDSLPKTIRIRPDRESCGFIKSTMRFSEDYSVHRFLESIE